MMSKSQCNRHLELLLYVLEDDDDDIRQKAEDIAVKVLQLDSPVQDCVAVGLVSRKLCASQSALDLQQGLQQAFG